MPNDVTPSIQSFRRWDTEVFLITASGHEKLPQTVKQIQAALQRAATYELRDVAYTLNCVSAKDSCRVAVVASSIEDLVSKLDQIAAKFSTDPPPQRIKQVEGIYYFANPLLPRSRIAFLFPGEGSQYIRMLADMAVFFPEVRLWFDLMDHALWDKTSGRLPSQAIFPQTNGNGSAAWNMDEASEAVFSATQGLLALLRHLEIRPDAVAGHSTGEYSALLAAGAVRVADQRRLIADILELNRIYAELSEQRAIPEGSLLAVGGCGREAVLDVIEHHRPDILLAMENCPNQVVLFGTSQAIAEAVSELRAKGAVCDALPFNRAYHTPLFESFRERVLQYLARLDIAAPDIPIYSCTSAGPFPNEPQAIRELAASHWTHPVRFEQTIEKMYADGIRVFVEVGPRANLTAFVNDILRRRPHEAVASNVAYRSGTTQINHLAGLLAAHGLSINFKPLYERRGCREIDLFGARDSGSPQHTQIRLSMNLPRLSLPAQLKTTPGTAARAPSPAAAPDRQTVSAPTDSVMDEYLRTMSMMLETQRQVMTSYLANQAAANPVSSGDIPLEPVVEPRTAKIRQIDQVKEDLPARHEPPARSIPRIVLETVADRTGYPLDMLDTKLDLEGDLGIDSIKRVEIVGALQRQLADAPSAEIGRASGLKTLQQVIDYLTTVVEGGELKAPPKRRLPFVREIISIEAGKRLVAACTFEVGQDLFLQDHTLGRDISVDDPALLGLPLVPLAISLEMMAEAAVLLAPDMVVTGLRDVVAHRWVPVENGKVTMRIAAERAEASGVRVLIYSTPAVEGETPSLSGTVVLGNEYPAAPDVTGQGLIEERVVRSTQADMYAAAMFTGPRFQGVASVDGFGSDSVKARLRVPALPLLSERTDPGSLVLNPVLLDAAGQVIGFWTAERFEKGFVVFPYGLTAMEIFTADYATATELVCEARIAEIGDQNLSSTLTLSAAEGRCCARITGWLDRRFPVPRSLAQFVLNPRATFVTEIVGDTASVFPESVIVSSLDLAENAGWADDQMWLSAVAHLILSSQERELFKSVGRSSDRRRDWLLGRLAAKDSVRRLVLRDRGLHLAPADVVVLAHPDGSPSVTGKWIEGVAPRISITHSGGRALAVAAPGQMDAIGLDLTLLQSTRPGFLEAAFGEDEVAAREPLSDEWILRLWAAKEAVGKALGQGLTGGPRSWRIARVDMDAETVFVLPARTGQNQKGVPQEPIEVRTRRIGDFILAGCSITRSDTWKLEARIGPIR